MYAQSLFEHSLSLLDIFRFFPFLSRASHVTAGLCHKTSHFANWQSPSSRRVLNASLSIECLKISRAMHANIIRTFALYRYRASLASLALRSAKMLYTTKTLRNFDSIFKFKFKLFPDFSRFFRVCRTLVCDDSLIDDSLIDV